jgi:hypothetical protein
MRVVGLVRREMARVDLAPVAVRARPGGRPGPLEELDDPRVRSRDPPRKLDRIALVVAALLGDRILVVGGDRRAFLVDAPLDAVREDLGGVGDMADDLHPGPLVELGATQTVSRHRPHDAGDRRRVVRQEERLVLVVAELFHILLLSRMYELWLRKRTMTGPSRVETGLVRELAAAAVVFIALATLTLAPRIWPEEAAGGALGPGSASSTPSPTGPASWRGKDGGAGFVVCGSSDTWARPTIAEESAHLAADPRYSGTRVDDNSAAARQFLASAVLYDGAGSSTRSGLVMTTGLWSDPEIGHAGCASAEPQIWLFGYEPVSYRGGWPGLGELAVRKVPGYRMVVLTGQLGSDLVLVDANGKLAVLDTRAWIGATPTPAPKRTLQAPSGQDSPFPVTDRPLELTLPRVCLVSPQSRQPDGSAASWTVQCGSPKANLSVAILATKQGWSHVAGPPIGVGMQTYVKGTLSMQLAYRLDGPAYSDPFIVVQYSRPFAQGSAASDPLPIAYLRVPTGFDLPSGCVWQEGPAGFTSDGAYELAFTCGRLSAADIRGAVHRSLLAQGWRAENGGFGFMNYGKDDLRLTAMFANTNAEPSDMPWVVESICCFAP